MGWFPYDPHVGGGGGDVSLPVDQRGGTPGNGYPAGCGGGGGDPGNLERRHAPTGTAGQKAVFGRSLQFRLINEMAFEMSLRCRCFQLGSSGANVS